MDTLLQQCQHQRDSLRQECEAGLELMRRLTDKFRQAKAENARLAEVLSTTVVRLARVSQEAQGQCAYQSCQDDLQRIAQATAALAEGYEDEDGELKPEVEARLRASLKTPREELLTSDEMRQKLEQTDADPD